METLLLYCTRAEERRRLLHAMRASFAAGGDDDLRCLEADSAAQAMDCLHDTDVSLLGWDVRDAVSCAALQDARGLCRDAFLLIIADSRTSPLSFLKPSIAPDSLILTPPLQKAEAQRAAEEMLAAVRARNENAGSFTITTRTETIRLPYERIDCFEARERRLYACLQREEIGFAGTLEHLEEQLPPSFLRVHRAFIVNTARIRKVQMTEGYILLTDGMRVPLARSYKKTLRERYAHGTS